MEEYSELYDQARDLAIESLPSGMFNLLPKEAQEAMVSSKLENMGLRPLAERAIRYEEKERKLREYREQKERESVVTRQQLAASGIAERVAYDWSPHKLNKVEVGHIDYSCEFSENEPRPEPYLGGLLMGFRRETIMKRFVPEMQEIWNKAEGHAAAGERLQRSATGYVMFHLWCGGMRRAGTTAVPVYQGFETAVDRLYKALSVMVDDIERVKSGYESIYNGEHTSHLHLYFRANYYPEPKSVKNWGENLLEVEKCKTFDIFTANDPDIPCVLQVARRIWPFDLDSPDERRHIEATESDIESIIRRAGENKVCIVKPHSSIRDVREINDYSDLVVEARSPVKSLTVIDSNCIYLLHFNEHLGLLENVKQQNRNRYYTSFRPLQKYPNCKKVTMCFDIECYFDPYNSKDHQRHIPYLCCACFVYDDNVGNVVEFEGRDCIAQMLDYAAENVSEFGLNSIELIAHNGGGYDFHYILSSMYDPGAVHDILIRNNHFISFKFKHLDIKFSVKDSLNFLLCSLRSAAKAFLNDDIGKTDFPHHEIKSASDLDRTFKQWTSVDRTVDVKMEKEKMIVTSKNYIKYNDNNDSKSGSRERNERKKLIDWAKEYCCNDVIVLANVWIKFKQTVANVFNCHIVDQTYTLAGMSFRLFEAHLPSKIKLHHPTKIDFINMREALFGGRCISVNGMHHDIVCLDVKSLYPTAMAYYDQPYGSYRKVNREIDSELGIYYCRVIPYGLLSEAVRKSRIDSKTHGFFPLKDKDGDSCYLLSGQVQTAYKAWYTTVDMEIGRLEGHCIESIAFDEKGHVGYSWKNKGKIFKEYIQDVLYRLKIQYEECGDKEKRQVIKIIMNSLWGKFAQKWMDTQYHIMDEGKCDMEEDECCKIWDTDWFMVKKHQKKTIANKPIQNGVFTLSWARWHMKLLWDNIAKPGAICLYSDTDSICIAKKDMNHDGTVTIDDKSMLAIGNAMGQLETEHCFDELICVGKKQYIGSYKNDNEITNYKKRFKGVPLEYIRPEMYAHLLKHTTNKVQLDFLKFKREWGAVHGYIESKTVTQT